MDVSHITDELLDKVSAMSEGERKVFLGKLPDETSDQVKVLLAADKAVHQNSLLKPVTGENTDEMDAIDKLHAPTSGRHIGHRFKSA